MYKRVILCIALAVLLCLGLCACGSGLPQKQLDILQGTWFNEMAFDSDGKPEEGVPYLIELTKYGKCAFNGEGGMTWEGEVEEQTGHLKLKIKQKQNVIYTLTIAPNHETNTTSYIASLTDKEGEAWLGNYMRPGNPQPYAELLDKLSSVQWSPAKNSKLQFPVTINADGTCVVDGKTYNWALIPMYDPSNYYSDAIIYDNTQTLFLFDSEMYSCGMPDFYLYDIDLKTHGEFNWHPLQEISVPSHWTAFDKQAVPDYVAVYKDHFFIDDDSECSTWELSDSTTDEQLVICAPDAVAPKYVLTITMETVQEYVVGKTINVKAPRMALEIKETGEIIHFYEHDSSSRNHS